MAEITGWPITRTDDFVGATSDTSEMIGYSSALRRIAVKVNKICNDLPALQRPPLWAGRDQPARHAARLVHHARQGQPRHPRGHEPGLLRSQRPCVTMAGDASQRELNAMELGDGSVPFRSPST